MTDKVLALARLAAPLVCVTLTTIGVAIRWEIVYIVILLVLTVAACIYSWWKNNNMSINARISQVFLELLKKSGEISGASWSAQLRELDESQDMGDLFERARDVLDTVTDTAETAMLPPREH